MDQAQEITRDFSWLVLDTIRKMRDALAAKETEKYVNYCLDAIQLIQPYIAAEFRAKLNVDKEKLDKELVELKGQKKLDDKTKALYSLRLRRSFADAHKSLIYSALPTIGVVKLTEEGVIDFSKRDADFIKSVIRNSGKGFEKAVKEAADKEIEKDEPTGGMIWKEKHQSQSR